MDKKISPIGILIETDIKQVYTEFKNLTDSELKFMKMDLVNEYQKIQLLKDSLLFRIDKNTFSKRELKKANMLCSKLYLCMQKIEERCSLIQTIKKERSK